jgi:hypothetical protein
MGCEIIVIGIGAGPTKFTVHANLLCLASKKLAEWIKQPLAEGQKFRSLPAEDPDTFKLLIEVLYSRRVPSVAPSTIREAQRARTLKLCQLYCFMERYGVNVNFMNLTMDKIQDGFAILRTYPDVKLIAAINQHSGPASQLRKFCAHSVLFWMYSAEYKDNHTLVHLLHGKAFANSFIDALRAANAEHYITSVDPRIRDCGRDNQCAECGGNWSKLFGKAGMKPCYFHVHPDETKGADGKHPSCHLWKA